MKDFLRIFCNEYSLDYIINGSEFSIKTDEVISTSILLGDFIAQESCSFNESELRSIKNSLMAHNEVKTIKGSVYICFTEVC